MAIYTGIDIVNVSRIKKIIQLQKKRFLARVFTPREIAYCEKKANKYVHYAARFAAKEAFFKAANSIIGALSYKDIEVSKRADIPSICLNQKKNKARKKLKSISISISHEKEFAVAVAVVET